MKKFTKQDLSDHIFIMGTALLECAIQNNITIDKLKVFKSKKIGVYYLVGLEKNEKGQPTTCYFKKDFR
jgi:hypothetical protein